MMLCAFAILAPKAWDFYDWKLSASPSLSDFERYGSELRVALEHIESFRFDDTVDSRTRAAADSEDSRSESGKDFAKAIKRVRAEQRELPGRRRL